MVVIPGDDVIVQSARCANRSADHLHLLQPTSGPECPRSPLAQDFHKKVCRVPHGETTPYSNRGNRAMLCGNSAYT